MVEARETPKDADMPNSRREGSRAGSSGEAAASRREASRAGPASETEQLLVTLSVATGEIVKVEKLDQAGKRHELSEIEYAELAVDDQTDELEAALEEAYEAGIGDALGEDDDGANGDEPALRRLVVGRLLVRGMLRRGLRRRLLRRAIRRRIVGADY